MPKKTKTIHWYHGLWSKAVGTVGYNKKKWSDRLYRWINKGILTKDDK